MCISDFLATPILYYTGLLYSIYLMSNIFISIVIQLYRKYFPIDFVSVYGPGSYALITGPTSGIGLEMARKLCESGLNLVLVGRDAVKLATIRGDLLKAFPKRTIVVIQKDFKNSMDEGFHKDIADKTSGLDVSLVINNVGVSYSDKFNNDLYIENKNIEEILEMINVNILSYTMNHFYFYPRFQKRSYHSGFVDISSVSGISLFTNMNIYQCTKAFVTYMSNSLSNANSDSRIHHLVYVCGPVETKMLSSASNNLKVGAGLIIDPQTSVRSLLNCLGIAAESSAHFKHEIMRIFFLIIMPLNRTLLYDCLNFFWRRVLPK
jgi:17beta-estradiol 17-dehydrogenase / very-long-chain 3-oxoacyl-CoA reductase